MAKIETLKRDPFPVNYCKLEGAKSIYRVQVRDYRIVYEVKVKEHQVIIYRVRHRKDAYRR